MKRTPDFIILLFFVVILSCSSNTTHYSDNGVGGTGNIALNGDDESGIGGTGKAVANAGVGGTGKQLAAGLGGTGKKRSNGMGGTGHQGSRSGLGGTGQIAETSGLGGTGIIGEVTGFGSVFVNGIEVEIVADSEIRTDNKVNNTIDGGRGTEIAKLEIGDIVEILAHRVGDKTHAKRVNIRHEVIGPVESVNARQRRFTIIGQNIKLDKPGLRLPKPGEMIAVSGLRDRRGVIHATRLSLSKSKSVWLIDQIASNELNALKLGRSVIKTEHANYYRKGDVIRVRASYKNGKLFANEIFSNQVFGKQVQHLILQGFIHAGNRNNYQIGSMQFSTPSARIRSQLKQNHGRLNRIEVRRNPVGLWEVEHFIDKTNLMRGSLKPHHSKIKPRRMPHHKLNSQATMHDRFNRSHHGGNEASGFSGNNPMTSGKGEMNHNPMNPNSSNPARPMMPMMPMMGPHQGTSSKPTPPASSPKGSPPPMMPAPGNSGMNPNNTPRNNPGNMMRKMMKRSDGMM